MIDPILRDAESKMTKSVEHFANGHLALEVELQAGGGDA